MQSDMAPAGLQDGEQVTAALGLDDTPDVLAQLLAMHARALARLGT